MKEGFIAIILNRKSSVPSIASFPKASAGICVALQHMPTRSHERKRRLAFSL